jgi:hypothetical protein
MDMRQVGTHCKGDACAGLGDRVIVGIRSVDVRVASHLSGPAELAPTD